MATASKEMIRGLTTAAVTASINPCPSPPPQRSTCSIRIRRQIVSPPLALSSRQRQFLRLISYSLLPLASSSTACSSEKVPNPLQVVCPLLRMEGLWTVSSIEKNKGLIEHLLQYGSLKSNKVAEVMETIDRGLFVPDGNPPYSDSPMPIGYNATISAPHMHATCLELLKDHLKPGMRALDVGSGSGCLTACFAMMVGPDGHAAGVEHIPELVAVSIENINRSAAAPLLDGGSLSLHVSDGRLGWPELAPYDAIHVGAAASEIPTALLDQLKPGGRMVIPVGNIFQDLKVVDKNLNGSITIQTNTSVRYVPLTSRAAQLQE
ncbi:protein-L-isoaspartate O-methyltransferase-like [Dendrobium catenatum]|uniref:protein-L-isoaspartate O-methyltransferase-like n=1 Tax=Dendrobium catenatum TaxID=906689 RepID=UPI00109F9F29|nr:protein-L-isoaspartate O-methyltransferase-like [Dendrobium catenatum]